MEHHKLTQSKISNRNACALLALFLWVIPSLASAQVLTVSPQPTEGFVFLSIPSFQTGPCGIERGTPENRCTISPTAGALVTLTATANPSYQFLGWSGACSGTSTRTTVTVSTNITCTPHFTRPAYTQVATFSTHQCAVTTIGTVQCWGAGSNGRLGNGQNNDSSTPVTVQGISTAMAISTGNQHTCVLLMDKTAQCWGSNSDGQLGIGTQGGIRNTPQAVVALSNVVAIAAGENYTCAVREGGQALCWGGGNAGNIGALGLGTTITQTNTPTAIPSITNATAVGTGITITCALLNTGSAQCWGLGIGGLGTGDTLVYTPKDVLNLSNATTITVGRNHACALLRTGKVKCWGRSEKGQLGTGNNNDSATPADVTNLSTAVAILAGAAHTCALLVGGSIKCWGDNEDGELGLGGGDRNTPTTVPSITTAISVSAGIGFSNTCALLANGNAYCWGQGYSNVPTLAPGQIGAPTLSATVTLYKNHPFIIASPYRAIPASRVTRIPSWLQYSASTGVFFGTPGSTAASGITITPPSNPPLPLSPIRFSISVQDLPTVTSLTIEDADNRDNDIPTDAKLNAQLINPRFIAKGSDNKEVAVGWSLTSTDTLFTINADNSILTLTGVIALNGMYTITVQADFPTLEATVLQPSLPTVSSTKSSVIKGVAVLPSLKLYLKTFLEGPLQ